MIAIWIPLLPFQVHQWPLLNISNAFSCLKNKHDYFESFFLFWLPWYTWATILKYNSARFLLTVLFLIVESSVNSHTFIHTYRTFHNLHIYGGQRRNFWRVRVGVTIVYYCSDNQFLCFWYVINCTLTSEGKIEMITTKGVKHH